MLKLLIFVLSWVLPLAAHRGAEKRADRIREAHLRMGRIEKNPGARKREWQAKHAVAVIWMVLTAVIELMFWRFVVSTEGILWTVGIATGLSYLVSHAFRKAIYDTLDRRATDRQLDGFLDEPSGPIVIDTGEILRENGRFSEPVQPVVADGQLGTGKMVDSRLTELVDPDAAAPVQIGDR